MFGHELIPRGRRRRFTPQSKYGRSMLNRTWLGLWKRAKEAKQKKQACECTTCQCKTK